MKFYAFDPFGSSIDAAMQIAKLKPHSNMESSLRSIHKLTKEGLCAPVHVELAPLPYKAVPRSGRRLCRVNSGRERHPGHRCEVERVQAITTND
jgi:hypothetical protein